MASSLITSWQIDGQTMETVTDFIFLGFKITSDGDCSTEIKRCLLLGRKAMTNLDSILKSRDITLPTGSINQSYGFSSSHVWIWELDHKEGWVPKNLMLPTVVWEKALENLLDSKEIKPVNLKGDQSWIFIGKDWCWSWSSNTSATDATSWLIGLIFSWNMSVLFAWYAIKILCANMIVFSHRKVPMSQKVLES